MISVLVPDNPARKQGCGAAGRRLACPPTNHLLLAMGVPRTAVHVGWRDGSLAQPEMPVLAAP